MSESQTPAEGIMLKDPINWTTKWYTVDCKCGHNSAQMELSVEHDVELNAGDISLTWYVKTYPKIDWRWKPWRVISKRIVMAFNLLIGRKIEWEEAFMFSAQQARNIGAELIRAADDLETKHDQLTAARKAEKEAL